MNALLIKSIILATCAHDKQVDKAGQPYILHPLRVMLSMRSLDEQVVAVLHDVLEDSDLTADDLRKEKIPEHIIETVQLLTKRENDTYKNFIERLSNNSLASWVKIADIRDNLNIFRLDQLSDSDLQRIKRYHQAVKTLEKKHSL